MSEEEEHLVVLLRVEVFKIPAFLYNSTIYTAYELLTSKHADNLIQDSTESLLLNGVNT